MLFETCASDPLAALPHLGCLSQRLIVQSSLGRLRMSLTSLLFSVARRQRLTVQGTRYERPTPDPWPHKWPWRFGNRGLCAPTCRRCLLCRNGHGRGSTVQDIKDVSASMIMMWWARPNPAATFNINGWARCCHGAPWFGSALSNAPSKHTFRASPNEQVNYPRVW